MSKTEIAIIAALRDEIRVIESKMNIDSRVHVRPALFSKGTYKQRDLLLVRTGVGKTAMKHAMEYCLDKYHPEFCLHVGYCGGADPRYQQGDLLIASSVIDERGEEERRSDRAVVESASDLCRRLGLRARIGILLTVRRPVVSPHEKAFVGTRHGVQGIDMESSVFAALCDRQNVKYLIVRSVLDPMDEELPDMMDVIDEWGNTNGMAIAENIVRKPKNLLKLPKIGYLATEARGAITAFVDAFLEHREEL